MTTLNDKYRKLKKLKRKLSSLLQEIYQLERSIGRSFKKCGTKATNTHHRVSKKHGGSNDSRNKSRVFKIEHDAFNILFDKTTDSDLPENIARTLTEVWIDPDKAMICIRKDKLKEVTIFLKQLQKKEGLVK